MCLIVTFSWKNKCQYGTLRPTVQNEVALPCSLSAAPSALAHRIPVWLRDEIRDYDSAIRMVRAGVAQAALDQDIVLWRTLGAAIAELAKLISGHCAASAFCDARPKIEVLATRLVEAIDDQVDDPAWGVIAAEARFRIAE
jgi:hypothetical protein